MQCHKCNEQKRLKGPRERLPFTRFPLQRILLMEDRLSIPAHLCISTEDKHILDPTFFESYWKRGKKCSVTQWMNTTSSVHSTYFLVFHCNGSVLLPKSATRLLLVPASLIPGRQHTAISKVCIGTLWVEKETRHDSLVALDLSAVRKCE